MVSVRGKRRVPYAEFHTGYKRNVLAADELVYAIHLPRRFAQHRQYLRKVGTRRAMAIAKVALAGTALAEGRRSAARFDWLRRAWRPFLRGFTKTEAALAGQAITPDDRFRRRAKALLAEGAAHRRHSLDGRVPEARWRKSA